MKIISKWSLVVLLLTTQVHIASILLSSDGNPPATAPGQGISQLTSLLSSLINAPKYPGYPPMYSSQMTIPPPLYSPMMPINRELTLQQNPLKQIMSQIKAEQAPAESPKDRELVSVETERDRLENFLEQFLIVSKRHTYHSYFSFRKFYKTYLEKAEDLLKINHQEFTYLMHLEKFIFVTNYQDHALNYTVIRSQMSIIIRHEHSDILSCLVKNQSFTPRSDYYDLIQQKDPMAHDALREKMSPHDQAKFSSKYARIRHLMKMERVWHKCLRDGKKDHISQIRRRELKKSIRRGQAKLKKTLKKAKEFMDKNKGLKTSKDVRNKMRVLQYLVDMVHEHKMGSFYARLSSFYKDMSITSKLAWSAGKQKLLDQKALSLHAILSPLSFLTSAYRVLNVHRALMLETAPKIKHLDDVSREMSAALEDPLEKAIVKVYFDVLLERIREIDFFLFRKPKSYFSVTTHKVLSSVLAPKTGRDFVQFNANMDLLFIQIAKLEFFILSGRNVKIMNDVRPKYFKFFRMLIEPLVKKKRSFNMEHIERQDKEYFDDLKNLKEFRQTLKDHLRAASGSKRIGDLDVDKLKSEPKDSLRLTEKDVHEYLESDKDIDDMDFPSGQSNDYFYEDSKPANRHKGSEVSSEVNLSEIEEVEMYEDDLEGKKRARSEPTEEVKDDSVKQEEADVANESVNQASDQAESPKTDVSRESTKSQSSEQVVETSQSSDDAKTGSSDQSQASAKSSVSGVESEKSQSEKSGEKSGEEDIVEGAKNEVILTELAKESSPKDEDSDEDTVKTTNRKMKSINLSEYETSDGDTTSVDEINLSQDLKAPDHETLEIKQEDAKSAAGKDIPVKVQKKTVINKLWINGGFKKRSSKFSVRDFENEEDDVESMIVSMPDLKKVKISRLLVLKAKIVSEMFQKFFSGADDETLITMIDSGQKLMRNGILKKSTSQKLNYLLLVVAEGNRFRETIADNQYFDQILDLWKVFVIEFACSCQLKLYIRLLKRMELVEGLKYVLIWRNLMRFLVSHREYDFVKCEDDMLRVWMNSTIFTRKKKAAGIIRDSFKKIFIKHKHAEKVKSQRRKKVLLKKILNKIRKHSVSSPFLGDFQKSMLLDGAAMPGNKVTEKDPKNVKTVLKRKPLDTTTSKGSADLQTQSKTLLFDPLNPGNKITEPPGDEDEGPKDAMNYSQKFQTLFKKKTMMNVLMGHLKKVKLKSSEAVQPDLMKFTKSLVVGTLIDSKRGEPSLANLAKISFKLTPKNMSYIERLKTEYRNVDNIRISDKHDSIFDTLKKIFFKPRRPFEEPLPPEKELKKLRKRMRKRLRRRKSMFKIFKKCRYGQRGKDGCCEDQAGGDDSVYNYRPNYEFKFDFENESQMAQFEEFLRNTEAIDKLLSSNMIDMQKAKEEFQKAKFSKTFHVEVNGKRVSPEHLLEPKDDASGDSEADTESGDSPKDKKQKLGAMGDPILTPVDIPLSDRGFDLDMKKIDQGYKNQPSIESAIDEQEIAVDENGNPIDRANEVPVLTGKVEDQNGKEDELKQFIDNVQPIIDEERSQPSQVSEESDTDQLDHKLDDLIRDDLNSGSQASDTSDKSPHELDNLEVKSNGEVFQDPLESPSQLSEFENRVFKPSNRERDGSQEASDTSRDEDSEQTHDDASRASHFADALDQEDRSSESGESNASQNDEDSEDKSARKRDDFYANKLVEDAEDELQEKLPMKNFRFGSKDWKTDQVYTNDIKDEGILGADINKYPEMSDGMKAKLNREIEENGGYPNELDNPVTAEPSKRRAPGQIKIGYMPFHVEQGNLEYSPLNHIRFVI